MYYSPKYYSYNNKLCTPLIKTELSLLRRMLNYFCSQINKKTNNYYTLKLDTVNEIELQLIYNWNAQINTDGHILSCNNIFSNAIDTVK